MIEIQKMFCKPLNDEIEKNTYEKQRERKKPHLVLFSFSEKFNFMSGFGNPKDFVEFIFEIIEFFVSFGIGKQFRELKRGKSLCV